MLKRVWILIVGILLIGLLSSCQPQATQEPGEKLSSKALRGKTVFINRCQSCHKVKGRGGKRGPDLTHIAEEAQEKPKGWLDKFLQNPQAFPEGRRMPRIPLTSEQRSDLIEYLNTLK